MAGRDGRRGLVGPHRIDGIAVHRHQGAAGFFHRGVQMHHAMLAVCSQGS